MDKNICIVLAFFLSIPKIEYVVIAVSIGLCLLKRGLKGFLRHYCQIQTTHLHFLIFDTQCQLVGIFSEYLSKDKMCGSLNGHRGFSMFLASRCLSVYPFYVV